MKKIFNSLVFYTILGLSAGVYFRTITQITEFTGTTYLSILHTHLLILGVLVFLILIPLELKLNLSKEKKLFNAFGWFYNIGVLITAFVLAIRGTLTVLGSSVSSEGMVAGIAGIGHILLATGFTLLLLLLKKRLKEIGEFKK